jgi:hypothetical protein
MGYLWAAYGRPMGGLWAAYGRPMDSLPPILPIMATDCKMNSSETVGHIGASVGHIGTSHKHMALDVQRGRRWLKAAHPVGGPLLKQL